VALRKFPIASGPLLHQCRRKRARQAEDQTEEPQHVNPDGGRCRFERLIALRCNDGEGCPGGDVDKLLSYLDKERIGHIAGIGR
jgi:hypothetical protein